MNDTTDLIAWMREQTGIDKQRAEDADPKRHREAVTATLACAELGIHKNVRFMADWDPARVLAEVEAKRRIIDAYEMANWHVERDNEPSLITIAETWREAVKLLATAYADRDGYHADAWKPWEPEL